MTGVSKERLEVAQWVFERNLGWIAAAEVKVAAICAIDTAMLAGLATIFLGDYARSAWANLFGGVSLFALFVALGCAALVLISRLEGGPTRSLLFFGKIDALSEAEYEEQLKKATVEELFKDWAAQIHYNARIAQKKHAWVRKCLGWSLLGAVTAMAAAFAALASS